MPTLTQIVELDNARNHHTTGKLCVRRLTRMKYHAAEATTEINSEGTVIQRYHAHDLRDDRDEE